MKPGAGEADDGHIGIGTGLVLRRGRRKPMLYVRAQPWTSEKDMSAHHTGNMQKLAWPVTSVWLRSWRVSAGEKAGGGVPQGCWRIVPDSDQSRRGLKGGHWTNATAADVVPSGCRGSRKKDRRE